MGAQIVEIGGHKIAMLSVEDYERLLELAEDRADILAADRAEERRRNGEEYVPGELVKRVLAGESPLRVWREYRALTQGQLAAAVGLKTATHISDLEAGKRGGSGRLWRKLARALNVQVEDILPDD
jgi:DNA-binding XRE family transcriptional regulator